MLLACSSWSCSFLHGHINSLIMLNGSDIWSLMDTLDLSVIAKQQWSIGFIFFLNDDVTKVCWRLAVPQFAATANCSKRSNVVVDVKRVTAARYDKRTNPMPLLHSASFVAAMKHGLSTQYLRIRSTLVHFKSPPSANHPIVQQLAC